MDILDAVIVNIKNEMKRQNMKQHEFAEKMGYGTVHMSNMLRKKKGGADSFSFLEKAARVLDVSAYDLLKSYDYSGQYTYVPDVDGVTASVSFKTEWLKQFKAREFFVLEMSDESMTPTIKYGDTLLIAKRKTLSTDGIYVFQIEKNVTVRRIIMQLSSQIIIHSDNAVIPSVTVSKNDINSALLGQVVWFGRTVQ